MRPSRARYAPGSATAPARTFGSTATRADPHSRSTTASSAVATGSSARPSEPTWTIATDGGSAASATSGSSPGADVARS